MDCVKVLDEILLSDNVVEDFYDKYDNNQEFKNCIDITIPEIKKCEEQKQNNPWHKYNVLKHILYSVGYMNSMTKDLDVSERRILAYTMFFHDMGKPECHIERIKDGVKIDSFFNHNIASTRIAKTTLPKLNFNDDEIDIICKLVYKHDIFMFIKLHSTSSKYHRVLNNDLIIEEINDLNSIGDGKKWLSYLVRIGRSDSLAQNEKMTKESFELLDKFERMLNKIINNCVSSSNE